MSVKLHLFRLLDAQLKTLQRLRGACIQFLENSESLPWDSRGFELFLGSRDVLLRSIELSEKKIEELVLQISPADRTTELSDQVRQFLQQRISLIATLEQLDVSIANRIREHTRALEHEAQSSRKTQQILGKFKSEWLPRHGEELDERR